MKLKEISPLTGASVCLLSRDAVDTTGYNDICGNWISTLESDVGGLATNSFRLGDRRLSSIECRNLRNLARSTVWRIAKQGKKIPYFMTSSGITKCQQEGRNKGCHLLSLERLYDEAMALTLERKSVLTLENLVTAEPSVGLGIEVPYEFSSYPGRPTWASEPEETGLTYGATDSEAVMVYQFLISREWIINTSPQIRGLNETKFYITPDGYSKVSELRAGAVKNLGAFFVCRFVPDMDQFYTSTVEPLGRELNCPILRVKDIHHVDKIDDRLCLEISRATIVIVDLSDHNFNVGFEAGYALALNKPIVWIKRKDSNMANLPFDIYTYNCLEWEPDKLDIFREALKYRIFAALEKAGINQNENRV